MGADAKKIPEPLNNTSNLLGTTDNSNEGSAIFSQVNSKEKNNVLMVSVIY